MDLSTSVTPSSLVPQDAGSDSFMLSVSVDDDDEHGLHTSVINRSEVVESVLPNIEGVPYLLDSDCLLTETSNLSQQVDDVYHSSAISLHSYSQVLPSIASESLHNYSQPIAIPSVGANTEVLHNYSQPWPQNTDSYTSVHNYCINNDPTEQVQDSQPHNEVKIFKLSKPNADTQTTADDPAPVCLKLQLVDQFVCQWHMCNEAFTTTQQLVEHVSTHIQAQTPGCYYCFWRGCSRNEVPFYIRYRLVQHMRIHTAERPHKCSLCNAVFSTAEGLTKHQRFHTGERPYPCTHPGCNKSFKNSGDRHKHMKCHKTKYPFVCKYPGCVSKYTDASTLRRHIRQKHPSVEVVKPAAPVIEKRIQSATLMSSAGTETVLDVSELDFTQINGSLYCEDHTLLASAGLPSHTAVTHPLPPDSSAHRIRTLLTNGVTTGGQDSPLDLSNAAVETEASASTNHWITFNPLDDT